MADTMLSQIPCHILGGLLSIPQAGHSHRRPQDADQWAGRMWETPKPNSVCVIRQSSPHPLEAIPAHFLSGPVLKAPPPSFCTQKQSGMPIQAPALVLTGHAPRACLPTLLLNLTPQHKRWVSLSISSVGCPPERTLSWSTEA